MLNLNEEWKKSYIAYLEEQEATINEDIDQLFKDLTAAQEKATNSFNLLKEYTLLEWEPGEAPLGEYRVDDATGEVKKYIPAKPASGKDAKNSRDKEDADYGKPTAKDIQTERNTVDLMKQLIGVLSDSTDGNIKNYIPTQTVTVQSIKDVHGLEKIFIFIKSLISWIVNVVVYFIEKIRNIIRRLVGVPTKELDPSKLKLVIGKVKKIEQVSTAVDLGKGKSSMANVWQINDPSAVDLGSVNFDLREESLASMLGIVKGPENAREIQSKPIMVTIDLSKDIVSLNELVQHFYDLYDNAYGSNNEKLFETEDLEFILGMFQKTIENVRYGAIDTFKYGSNIAEVGAINSSRVKQNLYVTNTNINALKEAYMKTSAKIGDIAKIITSKEMLMLTTMGVDYKMLTSATYNQIIKIVESIPKRLKDASELEKKLSAVQNQYNELVKSLSKMQKSFNSVSSISFDTIQNRRLVDLLNSATWMSQTVSLRLAGLGMYIKELKNVRDIMIMLSNINTVDPEAAKRIAKEMELIK